MRMGIQLYQEEFVEPADETSLLSLLDPVVILLRHVTWKLGLGAVMVGLLTSDVQLARFKRHQERSIFAELQEVISPNQPSRPPGRPSPAVNQALAIEPAVQPQDTNRSISLSFPNAPVQSALEFYQVITRRKLFTEMPLSGSVNLVPEGRLTSAEAAKLIEQSLANQLSLMMIHLDDRRTFVVKSNPELMKLAEVLASDHETIGPSDRYRAKSVLEWVEAALTATPRNWEADLMVMKLGTNAEPYLIRELGLAADATGGINRPAEPGSSADVAKAATGGELRRHRCFFQLGLIEPISPVGIQALKSGLTLRPPDNDTAADALARILQRSPERLPEFTAMLPELRDLAATNRMGASIARLIRLVENGGKPEDARRFRAAPAKPPSNQ
jgi:hypothetical protein